MLCTIDLLITPASPITLFLTSSSPASEYLLENQFIFNVSIFLPPESTPFGVDNGLLFPLNLGLTQG